MKKLKINFADFWAGFNYNHNFFTHLLKDYYELEISEQPDVLFYSCYSYNHLKYDCLKFFFTGENIRPNFYECDYSLSFDYNSYGNRNIRFPLFLLYGEIEKLLEVNDALEILKSKSKFCNMLVSNPKGKERNHFFNELSKYKRIDSGGKHLNNVGYIVKDRFDFIKDYKFTLAFENSSYPGYTTEKIFEPMKINSIPIYWGDPRVANDFNENSFINVHKYSSFNKAIDAIIKIDNNDNLFLKMLKEPYFKNNRIPSHLLNQQLLDFLLPILDNVHNLNPVSRTSKRFIAKMFMYRRQILQRVFNISPWNA